MSVSQFLSEYGYLALFIGSLLEGESILILAGFAIHQGYMSAAPAIMLATLGGTMGDQLFFLLGRYYGGPLLARFPKLAKHCQKVTSLIQCHSIKLILGVRFMYGLRIAGPIAIGISRVRIRQFVLYNILGAVIWATLIITAGYLFGLTLQYFLADIKKYETFILGAVLLVAGAIVLLHRYCYRKRKQ